MRSIPLFNFPAFDNARDALTSAGFVPVSPADIDRDHGFEPADLPPHYDWNQIPDTVSLDEVIARDIYAARGCDAYVLLEGWEKSKGARAEKAVLDWCGATRYDLATMQPWVETATTDDSNPKDLIGLTKPPLRLVPPALMIYVSKVMALGAEKYGPYNWREKKVRHSIYLEAAMRHILAVLDGEDSDPESGLPHEAHAAACMTILLDAMATGNLINDRPTPGAAAKLIKEFTESK